LRLFSASQKVRFSYCNLFTLSAAQEKYSVTLLIPKRDKATTRKLNAAMEAAKTAYLQKYFRKKLPSNLKSTLHDSGVERPNGSKSGA